MTTQELRPEIVLLAEMNEHHCLVFGGAMRIYTKRYDPMLKKFYYARSTQTDFKAWYMNRKVEFHGTKCSKAVWWLRQPGRRQYRGVSFAPLQDEPGYLNLWQGFSVVPSEARWDKFDALVRDIICNGDSKSYEYTMDWLAYLIQCPGKPAEVALVLRGAEGTGKGTFAGAIMEMIRSHSIQVSSAEHFTGRFNIHLRDCVFLFVDEAFWAGDRKSEGMLKRLITEPTLVFEGKGQHAQGGKNCMSVMIASNSDWIVPAGPDSERRYAVLDVSNRRANDKGYFGAIRRQIYDEGGLGGLFKHLQERDIKDWHPRNDVPQNQALAEQKLEGLTDVQEWWLGRLQEGRLPGQRGEWGGVGRVEAPMRTLHEHYLAEVGGLGNRSRRASQISFGRRLKKLAPGYANLQSARRENELLPADTQGRIRVLSCACLEDCRKEFEGRLGVRVNSDSFLD